MLELETIAAFGAGAALMALAPVIRKMGNQELGDSMGQTGRTMAKTGVKVGLVAAGTAGKVVQGVAKGAAEVAESFIDLVEEAKSESTETYSSESKNIINKKSTPITDVSVE